MGAFQGLISLGAKYGIPAHSRSIFEIPYQFWKCLLSVWNYENMPSEQRESERNRIVLKHTGEWEDGDANLQNRFNP